MGFELDFLPAVKTDLRDISAWYDGQKEGLGDDFADAFIATLPILRTNPATFACCYRDFRHVMIERFPYAIYFRIVGVRVEVFRIYHGARSQAALRKSLRDFLP